MAASSSGSTIEVSTKFPGFRFSPTDAELIDYYLKKKVEGDEEAVAIIAHVEICNFEPWDLPVKSIVQSDNEWFFFSSRGRRYPSGMQSKRATELGYWKATGKERAVKSVGAVIGAKRTLVFHLGRAPKGERTEWIIHEYNGVGTTQDSMVVCRLRKNPDFRGVDKESLPRQIPASTPVGAASGGEGSKTHGSSHASHSVDETTSQQEGRTVPRAGEEDDDDFFADILKDDIIFLDEPTFSSTLIPNFLQPDQSLSLQKQEKEDPSNTHLSLSKNKQGNEDEPKPQKPWVCFLRKWFWKLIRFLKK